MIKKLLGGRLPKQLIALVHIGARLLLHDATLLEQRLHLCAGGFAVRLDEEKRDLGAERVHVNVVGRAVQLGQPGAGDHQSACRCVVGGD